MTFLARCATCMLAIHEPTLRCPKCNSPRLVLVTGAWPAAPQRAATIPLEPPREKPVPVKESDEQYLARRQAEYEAKEAAKRDRQRFGRIAKQLELERRTFRADQKWRAEQLRREAAASEKAEQDRLRREGAVAERTRLRAKKLERQAELKRDALATKRRLHTEKLEREARAAAIARQARIESQTFRADRRREANEQAAARMREEREARRAEVQRRLGLEAWKAEPDGRKANQGYRKWLAENGRIAKGSTVALDSAHGTVLREVVEDLGEVVVVTRAEEVAAAKRESRKPAAIGFKKTDVLPSIEAPPETLFGSLMAQFGRQFPEFMARDGHRLAVPLPEFTAWLAAGGGE